MEANSINRISIAFGIVGLVALAAAGFLYVRGRGAPVASVAAQSPAADHGEEVAGHGAQEGRGTPKEEHEEGEGHGHGASEKSDLDRPVAELWAQKCEHDVLQYQCDECRYELGAVKLTKDLFGEKGRPGLVASGQARTESFAEALSLTGEVQLSEGRTVHVSSPLPGVLHWVGVGIGERVAAGDALFQVDSHDVAEAKADYLKDLAAVTLARKAAEREERLFDKKISAKIDVEEAQARLTEAEVELANARAKLLRMGLGADAVAGLTGAAGQELKGIVAIRAPRAGVILEKHGVVGEYVEPGKDLLLLSDLSEVWVWANLKEADLQAVSRAGGRATAEVEAPAGGRKYRGSVDIVSGTMDEQTRTVRARIVLANPGGALRPGMFVKVRLLLSGGQKAIAVPKVAVLADEGRPFVFVHKEADFWIRRPVTLGKRSGDSVEIVEGLSPGQSILADGSFLLKSDVLKKKMGAGCAD